MERHRRLPRSWAGELALMLASLCAPEVARADSVEALQRQVEAQSELIRQQSETLDRQSKQLEEMGDRLRMLEDERHASPPISAGGDATAAAEGERRPHAAGSGFHVATDEWGALDIRLYTYVRYLNQRSLDDTYTNAFGRTSDLDLRNDLQLNKVLLYFTGWAIDPKLKYLLYVWSANTSQGLVSQTLAAGNLRYVFNEHLEVGAGIGSLPGVRSTSGGWPFWLGVDERLIADEFFRPSYTTGIWANGRIVEGVDYQVMLGNNLSQLGIDAGQLNAGLETVSAAVSWMPQGEYGLAFGDFDEHQRVVTRVGLHFTHSDEDNQAQPDTDAFDNVQIRLSDGSVIFTPNLFGPDTQVRKTNYQMLAVDAGVKYRGWSLEGEYYHRWLTNLRGRGIGDLDLGRIRDQGFQLQASTMVLPERLQVYVSGSRVFGEFGDPWDARVGFNFFPFETRTLRWNNEMIYVKDSPVGALSLPYLVGADGPIFLSNLELFF